MKGNLLLSPSSFFSVYHYMLPLFLSSFSLSLIFLSLYSLSPYLLFFFIYSSFTSLSLNFFLSLYSLTISAFFSLLSHSLSIFYSLSPYLLFSHFLFRLSISNFYIHMGILATCIIYAFESLYLGQLFQLIKKKVTSKNFRIS